MDLSVPAMSEVDLGQVFRALSDPFRRRVVVELAAEPTDAERPCSSFPGPTAKSTRTHHWRTLREAGLVLQRDAGNGTFVTLRREEFEQRFPGLLSTVAGLTDKA